MIQAGEKKVRHKFEGVAKSTEEKIAIVAWTVWRDMHTPDEWLEIARSPERALQEMLSQEGHQGLARAVWGRSCKDGKFPSSPEAAQSIQIHASMPHAELGPILSKSGWNKWFATPKDTEGKPDPAWRVIWCNGTKEMLLGKTATLAGCSCLARNAKGFGVRVTATQHQEA